MKKIILVQVALAFHISVFAQQTPEQRIQDSVIGWWNNNQYDNKIKPSNDPVQKRRIQICDSIVSWVKKSYTPVAGLGTFTRYNGSLSFGVSLAVWDVSHEKMWTDEKGRFKPISEQLTQFAIEANTLPSATPVLFLNHEKDFYFLMEPDGYMTEQTTNKRKGYDFKNNPNVNKYITRITNNQNWVILTANNRYPFVPVSIGEFLDRAEASIAKEKILEKEKVDRTFSGKSERDKQSRDEAWALKEKQFSLVLGRINKWRQLYKNRLQEPASFRANNQTLLTGFNDDNIDPFSVRDIEKERKQYNIVYKVAAETVEKTRTDKPQWITVWWPFHGKASGNQLYEMSTAMLENINYEYIYQYFFEPDKVKNKAYKPANEESLQKRLNAYRTKYRNNIIEVYNTKASATGAYFFEDFSNGTIGTPPRNWYYNTAGVLPFVISKIDGVNGNWLKLSYGRRIRPSFLKTPIPQDFQFDFDVMTEKNFKGRTGGCLELTLNTQKLNQTYENMEDRVEQNGTVVKINIISGNEDDYTNNNYRGLLKISINSLPIVNRENFVEGISAEYLLKEFTNVKTKVHITIKVKDGKPSVFVNDKIVIQAENFKMAYGGKCVLCGIPSGKSFQSFALNNITTNANETGIYISNIKIEKL